MRQLSGICVVLQVPDQAGAKISDVSFNLPDILPETVQFRKHDWRAPRLAAQAAPILPTADNSPGHDHDQDADGSDDLSQNPEARHLYRLSL